LNHRRNEEETKTDREKNHGKRFPMFVIPPWGGGGFYKANQKGALNYSLRGGGENRLKAMGKG